MNETEKLFFFEKILRFTNHSIFGSRGTALNLIILKYVTKNLQFRTLECHTCQHSMIPQDSLSEH